MRNLFNSIQLYKPKRNVFNLSYEHKTTVDMGNLVPVCAIETVPGDSFTIGCRTLIRFMPLIAPVMHEIDCFIHYFFVPYRLLWDGWEDHITGTSDGSNYPYFTYDQAAFESGNRLFDYFGLPQIGIGCSYALDAWKLAAYQFVYNEYYRDQNMIDEVDFKLVDGSNDSNTDLIEFRRRAWEHDYFTSCLPFAQKGLTVNIPIGNIEGDVRVYRNEVGTGSNTWSSSGGTTSAPDRPSVTGSITADQLYANTDNLAIPATSINDLRRAEALQKWAERCARSGSRYTEFIRGHFGVTPSDARLQRPEYITGVKSNVIISEVLNTTGQVLPDGDTGTPLPQGNMAGHGVSVAKGRYGNFFSEEYGVILGIMSIMPRTNYQDGIHKSWSRGGTLGYYFPEFANIGEQEVLNQEVYANNSTTFGNTFGYVPRYAEYKFMPGLTTGAFRGDLDFWTLTRKFGSTPQLTKEFIECDPGKRIFAVTEEGLDSILVDHFNEIRAVRPMPKFGVPSI